MDNEQFSQQDFLNAENNFAKTKQIRSICRWGDVQKKPFISVVIPTYRRPELLQEAVASVLAQRGCSDYNIVITDNDPTPGNETAQFIQSLGEEKIIYFQNEANIGALANFNRCLEMAAGQYAVMLNTDDLLQADYLAKVSRLLGGYPQADLIIPDIQLEMNGFLLKPRGYQGLLRGMKRWMDLENKAFRLNINDFLLYNPARSPSGIIYRREAFLKSPGFNPDWHPTGDLILYINLVLKGKVYLAPIDAGRYRYIDNISQESGMRTRFIEQGYYLQQYLAAVCNKKWAAKYYRGSVYYRINKPENRKLGVTYDRESIQSLFQRKPSFGDFIFFAALWAVAMFSWLGRVAMTIAMVSRLGKSRPQKELAWRSEQK